MQGSLNARFTKCMVYYCNPSRIQYTLMAGEVQFDTVISSVHVILMVFLT